MAYLIITAAGSSKRMKGVDKIFYQINKKPVLYWTINTFIKHPHINFIVIVVKQDKINLVNDLIHQWGFTNKIVVLGGGKTRQESVAIGLQKISEFAAGNDIVLVHDGARPLISPAHIDTIIQSIDVKKAAILAIPVIDTVKKIKNRKVMSTVDREGLWLAQTPQGATLNNFYKAVEYIEIERSQYTDESSIFENIKVPVQIVRGDPTNIKITTLEDLELVKKLLLVLKEED